MPHHNNTCWAIVPAAGVGARMAAAVPKQYLLIAGKSLLEHSVGALLASGVVTEVVVAVAAADSAWRNLEGLRDARVSLCQGGLSRASSVLAGLQALSDRANNGDWVLVHDAARPCVNGLEIAGLYDQLQQTCNGGLWAVPVADTLKRTAPESGRNRVIATVQRDRVWRAQTPQMFRYGALLEALLQAFNDAAEVTDESSAMQLAGVDHEIVEGFQHNIKVTYPSDHVLAQFYLTQSESLS